MVRIFVPFQNINFLSFIKIFLISLSILSFSFSQDNINFLPIKQLIEENGEYRTQTLKNDKNKFNLVYNQSFFVNTNLPNFENMNGLYIPKGFGAQTGFLIYFKNKYLMLSAEPSMKEQSSYKLNIPEKNDQFSILNDVPLDFKSAEKNIFTRNLGFVFSMQNFSFGYGNWNRWWGPGIHNSLTMSNNSMGFYNYFFHIKLETMIPKIFQSIRYNFSEKIRNSHNSNFFLSSIEYILKFKEFELGISKNIISGGNNDIIWDKYDAALVIISKNNAKYWDMIYDYYITYHLSSIGLKLFGEFGHPNREFNDKNPNNYPNHSRSAIFGFRKQGIFGNKNTVFGLEYARLVQSIYYNLIPSSNWYDNIRYNYSSYMGRRWSAHSGSDSDDLLFYLGFINDKTSLVYGINYERHGVTYHFPPEVKLESRFTFSYKINGLFILLKYENEYFEHYGFVDSNINVWEKTFEPGSIQRTKSLLFSIEKTLY